MRDWVTSVRPSRPCQRKGQVLISPFSVLHFRPATRSWSIYSRPPTSFAKAPRPNPLLDNELGPQIQLKSFRPSTLHPLPLPVIREANIWFAFACVSLNFHLAQMTCLCVSSACASDMTRMLTDA